MNCAIGTLAAGASASLTVRASVGSNACATLRHRATVTSQSLDGFLADNTAVHDATIALPACADFNVALTASPVPVDIDSDLTYTMTVGKRGPDTSAAGASIVFPTNLEVTGITGTGGTSCNANGGGEWNCTVPLLAPGQQADVYVTARTSATASGLQTVEAAVTPTLPDPVAADNTARFRFAMGQAFAFTEIATLGVGPLAGYSAAHAVDIDRDGNVALLATGSDLFDYAVYVGDGTTLTRRFAQTDLPPPAPGLRYRAGFECLDLMEAGGDIAMLSEIHDPLDDGTASAATVVGSLLHRLVANGNHTTVASQTLATDGPGFRRFGQPVHWRGGIAVPFEVPVINGSRAEPDGVLHIANGAETLIYQARNTDIRIRNLNSNANGLTWTEDYGTFVRSYELVSARFDFSLGWTFTNVLPNFLRPEVSDKVGNNDRGGIAYAQVIENPATATVIESFHTLPGQDPELRALSISRTEPTFRSGVINNGFRFAFSAFNSSYFAGDTGIYTGPDPVAHRVLRSHSDIDPLLGKRVQQAPNSFFCGLAINDRGQLAFTAMLDDGRRVVVRADPVRDNDGDGVTDWVESGAPGHGDSNVDTVVDSAQPDVASTPTLAGDYRVAFTVDSRHRLVGLAPAPNPSPGDAPKAPFPVGHFELAVHDLDPGGRTTVTVTLPPGVVAGSWWKYGPTPARPYPHWYRFDYDGDTGAEIDGDGMTNGYETDNGLDPQVDDASGDLDQDGATNLAEFLAGTSANDRADRPGGSAPTDALPGILPLLLD